MSTVTLGADYWALAFPRLVQGVGIGFIFVPLNTVALATVPRERMGNATVLLNVVRNLGGAIGVAVLTTLLARRSQTHQATLVGHVDAWDPETAERLRAWATHFAAQGSDSFTAERRAIGVLYQEVTRQAQLLAFADDFWLLFLLFCGSLVLLPMLRQVRIAPARNDASPPSVHAD
jgi:DHA2 family multidrug resistance protein